MEISSSKMIRFLFFSFFFSFLSTFAQLVPIGDWQIHAPYNSGIGAVQHKNEIYFLGKYGAFKYSLDKKEFTKISKVSGLSDNGFSAIGYHSGTGTVIIGYQNGNLDLIKENTIINISSIKKAQNILGSKKINDIKEYQNFVFVSTDFGVVKIDVVKESIKETYKNITVSGNVIRVNQSLIDTKNDDLLDNDSIYLATDLGVMAANLSSTNLIDFNKWHLFDSTNYVPEREAIKMAKYDNEVYVVYALNGDEDSTLYNPDHTISSYHFKRKNDLFKKTKDNGWERVNISYDPFFPWYSITGLFTLNNELYLNNALGYFNINEKGQVLEKFESEFNNIPLLLFQDDQSNIYAIDGSSGFFKKNDNELNYFVPNGPYYVDVFELEFIGDTLFVPTGSYVGETMGLGENNHGYFTFFNSEWKSYSKPLWKDGFDIVDVAYHKNRNEIYIASYSDGIILKNSKNEYTLFNDTSLITTANPPFKSPLTLSYVRARISSVETDNDGLVWFTNYLTYGNPSLFRINNDGTWSIFNINHPAAEVIRSIVFDNDNNIWAISQSSSDVNGVLIISKEGTLKKFYGESQLQSKPNIIRKDMEGNMWVGTNTGIIVFKDPKNLTVIETNRPIIDGRYLLEEEVVTSITIDNSNRKWIGTTNGLWLFNADGTEQLAYFNIDNSPLLSNRIQSTEINRQTGELYIGTDFGIISYRTESTEGQKTCDEKIEVFPNPVPTNYNGFVGIKGVAENSIVKITDISGKLVLETTSYGGQAVWNVKDLKQQKVKTGIYLAYVSTEDGEGTCVTKIAVIE